MFSHQQIFLSSPLTLTRMRKCARARARAFCSRSVVSLALWWKHATRRLSLFFSLLLLWLLFFWSFERLSVGRGETRWRRSWGGGGGCGRCSSPCCAAHCWLHHTTWDDLILMVAKDCKEAMTSREKPNWEPQPQPRQLVHGV